MPTSPQVKALKAALKERQAELEEATKLVQSVQARLDEVRHDEQRAAKAVAEAKTALRLAQPLGKQLAKLLAESAESGGAWIRTFSGAPQRTNNARELCLRGLAAIGRQSFDGYRLIATDAGRAKLADG